MSKAAFLDRDGVINRVKVINGAPTPPTRIEEIEILDGVLEAIRILKAHKYVPVVITNQPDIARGTLKLSQVQAINEFIGEEVGISDFYVCPHDDYANCSCRKPKPGLIEIATLELGIDLKTSFLIGDRWKDIEAGQAFNLATFFIDYSYIEPKPKPPFTPVNSLLEAVNIRLGAEIESQN